MNFHLAFDWIWRMSWNLLIVLESFLLLASTRGQAVVIEEKVLSETKLDVIEGRNISLSCRFPLESMSSYNQIYWLKYENDFGEEIAIGEKKRKRNTRVHLDRKAGIYDLYIRAVDYSYHNGLYECVLFDFDKLTQFTRSINLTILAIPDEPELTPSQLILNHGENINVTCKSPRVFPDCKIIWMKKKLPSASNDFLVGSSTDSSCSSTINLIASQDEHGQELICKIKNTRLNTDYDSQASMQIQIQHKPGKTSISPPEVRGVKGNTIQLNCTANPPGFPPPVFRWRKTNTGELVGTGTSIVLNLETGLSGIECEAENEAGKGNPSSVTIEMSLEPHLGKYPAAVTEINSGAVNFTFAATAFAKPAAEVEWTKDSMPITSTEDLLIVTTTEVDLDDKAIFQTTSVITIRKASGLFTGSYRCKFSNQFGYVYSTTDLKIKDVPRSLNKMEDNEIVAELGQELTLECRFHGYPRPSIKWITSSSNSNIKVNETVSEFEQNSLLTIKKLRISDFTQFICQARNDEGVNQIKFEVKPKMLPNPKNVTVLKSSSNSITIQWNDGKEKVEREDENVDEWEAESTSHQLQYKIRYGIKSGKNERRNSGVGEMDCGTENPCKIKHLVPDTEYILEVIPYTSIWFGTGTALTAWTKTAHDLDLDFDTGSDTKHQYESQALEEESLFTTWIIIFGLILLLSLLSTGAFLCYKIKTRVFRHRTGVEIALVQINKLQVQLMQGRLWNQNEKATKRRRVTFCVREKAEDEGRSDWIEKTLQELEQPCTSAKAAELWSQIILAPSQNLKSQCDV